MRREALLLGDIVESADSIAGFLAGTTKEEFAADDLVRSAIAQKLITIGEAAARLPESFRDRHSEIPWAQIVSFRNILVHAYFSVLWDIVWETAEAEVPDLRTKVATILENEFD